MFRVIRILIISFCPVPFLVSAGTTDTASITIKGTVKANTCTVDKFPSAELPAVSTGDFKGIGTMVSETPVVIKFTNCGEAISGLKIDIRGTEDKDTDNGVTFKNLLTGEGAATGVGIVLYDNNNTGRFRPDGQHTAWNVTPKAGEFEIQYTAKYISTKEVVGGGDVSTTITATFTYS